MVVQFAGMDLSTSIVMGILNVTPDSFSDGGDLNNIEFIQKRAEEFCIAGVRVLDVGGESTRPGATPPTEAEEINRIVPAITAIRSIANQYSVKISIDTRRCAVMQAAVDAGADIVNDVSALETDAAALLFIASRQLPVILCHMQGTPSDMQHQPHYENVVQEIYDYFAARISACKAAGLPHEKICIDPGIGFGKTLAHNIVILKNLGEFKKLGAPLLIGLSRKRMIAEITGEKDAKARLGGSISSALFAAQHGANIIRVHDVKETVQALQLWRALAG